jgi:hypothetical protein
MPGQPAPDPPPLQTLETRLVRIEGMIEDVKDCVERLERLLVQSSAEPQP